MSESLILTPAFTRSAGFAHILNRSSLRSAAVPALAAAVLLLSILDGLATLRLLALGFEEANPAMRVLLAWGPASFLAGKLVVTAAGLRMLVAARGRPLFGTPLRAGHFLLVLAGVYSAVVVYELILWTWPSV
jgi:Domain of unknown function (DUF5658)